MMEIVKEWLSSLRNKWWGVVIVYFSVLSSVYLGFWAFIDPLNIPDIIVAGQLSVPRTILFLAITLIVSSHVTLSLILIRDWQLNKKRKEYSESFLQPTNNNLSPSIDQLIYEKVLTKDKKITEKVFASRVLLALNSQNIEEVFAQDLLWRSKFEIVKLAVDDVFTLTIKPVKERKEHRGN